MPLLPTACNGIFVKAIIFRLQTSSMLKINKHVQAFTKHLTEMNVEETKLF